MSLNVIIDSLSFIRNELLLTNCLNVTQIPNKTWFGLEQVFQNAHIFVRILYANCFCCWSIHWNLLINFTFLYSGREWKKNAARHYSWRLIGHPVWNSSTSHWHERISSLSSSAGPWVPVQITLLQKKTTFIAKMVFFQLNSLLLVVFIISNSRLMALIRVKFNIFQ